MKSSLSMFRLQHLYEVWIVDRHQRALSQARKEEEQPNAAKGNGTKDVYGRVVPVEVGKSPLRSHVEVGRRQPEKIHHPHNQDERGNKDQPAAMPLEAARKKQRKGEDKMDKDQGRPEILPAAAQAHQVPADL